MKGYTAALLLVSVALGAAESEQLPVNPGVVYRLRFDVEGASEGGRWIIHLRDSEGKLPYDGVLAGDWQRLTPGRKSYSHLFRAPVDAAKLRLVVSAPGVTLGPVKLEPQPSKSLILNGEFSEGSDNYSGWSEHYLAGVIEKDGRTILQVRQNGYALTDFIPVVGGGRYLLTSIQGAPGAQILAYDEQRRFLALVERKPGASFAVPAEATLLRVIYATGHHHLESWRTNEIVKAELVPETTAAPVLQGKGKEADDWEIVLAPGCDPREEHAARELRHWMTALTGNAPALLAEPSPRKTRKIFLGRAWADEFSDDRKALEGTDGFAVRPKHGNLYLFGAHPRGAFYGVHALLERNSDLIWPRPNVGFSAIFSKVEELTLEDSDFLSCPVFRDRYISGSGDLKCYKWKGRNGLNSPWHLHKGNNCLAWLNGAQLGYSGSYMFWLDKAREEDEKVLPLIDGQRVNNVWRQPCYTYPGTPAAILATMRKLLVTLPGREMEYLHATIADNWTVCGCPSCLAPIPFPDGRSLTTRSSDATKEPLFFSTRNFRMLNQVAEGLAKDHPGLQLRTHAYIFTAEPPGVPLHPAILPEFAAYPTQNLRYPIRSGKAQKIDIYDEGIWKRRFEAWGKVRKGALGSFGYYYPNGFNAVADTAAEDFQALAEFGGVQVHTEGFPGDRDDLSSWDADGIEKWVMAKLMWDPSRDPQALRADYIRRVYRGAETEMAAFYQLIRDAWHQAPETVFVNCHTPASEIFQNLIVTPGIEEKAKVLLADAEKAATHPLSREILRRHRAEFDRLAASLGRVMVPYVEESSNEWREATSPHWEKAAIVEGFRKVDDWRNFAKEASAHSTKVRVMHDRRSLYLRFDGADGDLSGQVKPSVPAGRVFPNGDRFEVRLRNHKGEDFYLAVGPGGHAFSEPALGGDWETTVTAGEKSWTALLAIPLSAVAANEAERTAFRVKLGRIYRLRGEEREESSHDGSGLFNDAKGLWLDFQLQ